MSYIGQTVQTLERRAGGINGCNYRKGKYLGPAIDKDGWENFVSEILAETEDQEYANLLEWFYTIEFNTQWPNSYNVAIVHSGVSLSEKARKSISEKLKGRSISEEHKKAISFANSGSKNGMYGKHLSEETKRKLSESHKGKGDLRSLEGKLRNIKANIGNTNVKGKTWFTNGLKNVRRFECPEGYWKGRSRWQ